MGNDEQILIYKTPNGVTSIDVRIKNETVWLNQNQMAELFIIRNKTSVCILITFLKKVN